LVEVRTHADLGRAEEAIRTIEAPSPTRSWLLSGKARRSYLDVEFRTGDAFVFGKESVGLPGELLLGRETEVIGIPTLGAVRSLNLANSVAIVLYEALRQIGALRVVPSEVNEPESPEPDA
jgi:tRNA(Leu) C34 or U34 (ribose-2'-O)-methylase TrmL